MKYAFCLFGLFISLLGIAQVNDDFSDEDFINNPVWSGDVGDFEVTDPEFHLQLNAAAAGESYLSTPQTELGETTWEFLVHFDFNPSSTSLAKIYLVSNQADLTSSLQGYFVMVGDSEDEISLYKQDGIDTNIDYVIDGVDDVIDVSTVHVRVRVVRDADGNWDLNHDTAGGTSYTQEGITTLDNEFSSTSYFGVYCEYIDSRKNAIYFDDIAISTTPVVASFGVSSLAKEGTNAIRVTFNQNLDVTTAETPANYSLGYGFGNPVSAVRDMANLDEVLLTFSEDFVNNDYTLNIDQVENEAQDETVTDDDQAFDVEIQTPFRNIVINEIMADPSPVVALPNAEYLELYNPTDQAIQMSDFMIQGASLGDFTLLAYDHLILTSNSNVGLFTGNVLGLSGFSLVNGFDELELTDNLGNLVDSVSYTDDWYNDIDKDNGGYSLEQINPELLCSYVNNWTASNDTNGGTPGTQNSVYDNSPDIIRPKLIDFIATDANTFRLTFDEPMDETSLTNGTYNFDNGVAENGITPSIFSTLIDVTPDLSSGVNYTVTATGVTDCAGNNIQINSLVYTYDTNPPALEHIVVKTANQIDIIFNEGLNQSIAETEVNYTSDHSGMNPTSAVLDDADASTVSLTFADDFELEVENTLTIENLQDVQGNALAGALTPTFTLSQQIDTVHVIGINLLDIYFKQDLDATSASTASNYSVDDGVGSASSAFVDSNNDRLVHLAFAKNFDNNKELILSISGVKNASAALLTTPEIIFEHDTSSPKLDTIKVLSATSLAVVFTEKVNKQSAESKENYEYEDIFPIEASLEADQLTVILDFAADFEREVIFELLIDEVKDLFGNQLKTRLKQEFVYDVFAPELDSIIVKSADELILWFNEDVEKSYAIDVFNYNVGVLGAPSTAVRNFIDQRIVNLILPSTLPETSDISLTISAMQDVNGNDLGSPINTSFDYDIFYIGELISLGPQSIQIEFNKTPSASTKNELFNYKLNGSAANTISFSEDRTAELTFETLLEQDSTYVLTVDNITDVGTNPLSQDTYPFVFDHRFLSAELSGERNITLEFWAVLDVNEVLDLSNFTASPSLGACQVAIVNSKYLHRLHLTFDEALDVDVPYTISWQNLKDTFGYIIPDHSTSVINDQTPASVIEHLILDETNIWLKYSEPLNETSAEFLLNYEISPGIGNPTEAKYTAADSSVLLEFSTAFVEDANYALTIDNIEDLSDNALFNHTINFTFAAPETPDFGDLIITEIMADPTPEVGLADKEYLEIYNTTDDTISLIGISIVDEGGSTTIVSGEIEPNQYLLLTTTSGVSSFSSVSVLGVTSFPSLNNTRETVSLYAGEKQIFSTSYSTDWYKDSEKEEGGWSLEMIDTNNPCGEINNWTASINEKGGTPGLANSVQGSNPDNFGPKLLTAIATDASTIEIELNEKLHPMQFESSTVSITPIRAIERMELMTPQNTSITVLLTDKLESGQSYEVVLTQVSDCKLNVIQKDQNAASFRLPEEAEPLDVVVNEVLFNPRVGGVDFVELYNNSEKTINLKNWTLADMRSDPKIITSKNLILNPREYLVFTTDPTTLNINYPKGDASRFGAMPSFPSLSDSEDSVILSNEFDVLIDQMEYKDDYHFNLLDDDDGVSLERVSFDSESTNPDSWKSAASTVGFATPGMVNSQYQELAQSNAVVSIDPQVFVPNNTGMNDFTTISYQLNQAGNFANVHIYSSNGVLIKTLAEGELLSTTGFFTWDGVTNSGNLASVGYYMVVFETFDGQGNKSLEKETVVLGAKF